MGPRPDLFVDTAGFGKLLYGNEPSHHLAVRLYDASLAERRGIVSTNYVIAELTGLLLGRLRYPPARLVAFIDTLYHSDGVEVVHITPELDLAARDLMAQRLDKRWSLVDCASFVVMQQRGLTEALTSDHHFAQAGFTALLAG